MKTIPWSEALGKLLFRSSNLRILHWGLFIFSFSYCLFWGRIGLNPLDSSIVFDGAWRILSGQEFMVDFYSPNGFTPTYLQSFFFRILGINWFAYVFHAALLNGFFSLLVFDLLKRFKLPIVAAIFYAGLSGIVFYAPFGTPYPEQHSFFFGLLGFYLLVRGKSETGKKKNVLLALVAPVMLLGILSKQVPAAYLLIFTSASFFLLTPVSEWLKQLFRLSLGLPLALILLWLMFDWGNVNWNEFYHYFWEMPAATGAERVNKLNFPPVKMARSLAYLPYQVLCKHNLIHNILVYFLPLSLCLGAFLSRILKQKPIQKIFPFHFGDFKPWILALGLSLTCSLFVTLTENQRENGIPFVFLSLGLGHSSLIMLFSRLKKAFPQISPQLKTAFLLINLFFASHALVDAISFHNRIVSTRMVHDFPPEQPPDKSLPTGFNGTSFLAWSEPWYYQDRNPTQLIEFLKAEQAPFFLFGDLSIVNALCHNPSVSPVLWMHEGLTLPPDGSLYRNRLNLKFKKAVQELQPKYWIFDHKEMISYKGLVLADFPELEEWVLKHKLREFYVHNYRIWELG